MGHARPTSPRDAPADTFHRSRPPAQPPANARPTKPRCGWMKGAARSR
ncbi:hypothetical protein [Halorussus caseinilyticus]|uniref:Uncharacterized protein n=1 Tax=Halorussus caseinilyticus TaxID=3034025 RepID=A0ABD5WPY9_9EURY